MNKQIRNLIKDQKYLKWVVKSLIFHFSLLIGFQMIKDISLYIDENWFGSEYWRKVLISIQPDNIPDEEFNVLQNSIVVEIWKGVKVSKDHLTDLKN